MSHILEIKNLDKSFDGLHAINDCSFTLEHNKIYGMIGPNGAGKTTLFNILTGLIASDKGQIIFKGEDITKLASFARANRGIARTFQARRIFPELTVLENILIALKGNSQNIFDFLKNTKHDQLRLIEVAHEYLKKIGLNRMANHKANEISYGQQKLLEIIRAVACEAELILLDEPAAGVNPSMLNQIGDVIQSLHREGKTFLIVEHDMNFIMNISQEIYALDFGHVIAHGTPQEIRKNKKVLEIYLGN